MVAIAWLILISQIICSSSVCVGKRILPGSKLLNPNQPNVFGNENILFRTSPICNNNANFDVNIICDEKNKQKTVPTNRDLLTFGLPTLGNINQC